MGDHIAVVVDWYGPYTVAKAQTAAEEFDAEGGWSLYMLMGKVKSQKAPRRLQYIGVSQEGLSSRLRSHPKIECLSQECLIWLGQVATAGIPGMKQKNIDRRADLVEWAHAYFLDLPLNTKKKVHPPDPVTVLNRWWQIDYKTPHVRRPHPDWPDLIDFVGQGYEPRLCRISPTKVLAP